MKDRNIIRDYLQEAIEELEDNLIDNIIEVKQLTNKVEKHRQDILAFRHFYKDESYIPEDFIRVCNQFNNLREKELKIHVENFQNITRITNLKSNLSWFDGSKKDE